ncbi:MAG: TetR/AcrR family transcriptional regulator, partial [Symploca sp. SIO1B1]|nr:TetR/AcrR family transcriptional regulator [Symploca sp. SIO1B1]
MGADKKSKSSATREKILQAAAQVVMDRGVEALTLDAVA